LNIIQAWWLVGYLRWIAGGMRMAQVGGRVVLPLAPALLSLLVLGALVGGLAAGLLCRTAARPRLATLATLGGVVLALVVTLVFAVTTVRGDDPVSSPTDGLAVFAVCAVVVVVSLAAWALASAAAFGEVGTGVALALLAGALAPWLSSLGLWLVDTSTSYAGVALLGRIAMWASAALLALALIRVGLRPPVRLAWWPVLLLAAWFVGPLLTAAAYLEPLLRPGMGLPGTLPDSLSAAWQVFWLSASPDQRDLLPWLAAVVAAVGVSVFLDQRGVDHRQVDARAGVSGSHPPMINKS
jgi:hypothetical protein